LIRPLLVIEILSPDDTYSDTQERAQDYRAMGVANGLDHRSEDAHGAHLFWSQMDRIFASGSEGDAFVRQSADIFSQLTSA